MNTVTQGDINFLFFLIVTVAAIQTVIICGLAWEAKVEILKEIEKGREEEKWRTR